MNKRIKEIERNLEKCKTKQAILYVERATLEHKKVRLLRGKQLSCPDCGRRSTLSKWVFIKIHYRDAPLGGIEGDWQERRPEECGVRCLKCKEGIFHITKLTRHKREKLLEVMGKAGPVHVEEIFKCVEEMEEEDLLTLCK